MSGVFFSYLFMMESFSFETEIQSGRGMRKTGCGRLAFKSCSVMNQDLISILPLRLLFLIGSEDLEIPVVPGT